MDVFDKVTLTGQYCRLEPLTDNHLEGLEVAVKDGELWTLKVTTVPHPDRLSAFLHVADSSHSRGEGLTFVTFNQASDQIVGSTRFMNADLANKRVEIGTTFLSKSAQRTSVNTEAKLLMLGHAFEVLSVNRVELKTDYLNTISRDAILRLGAKQEGIMRSHMVMPDGRLRDTVMFSILKNEWPRVKENLQHYLTVNR